MEEQNRGCPIVVWWDLGSGGLPSGYDALGVLETIKSAMNGLGFCGSLNVEALTVKGYEVKHDGNRYEICNRIENWKKSHGPQGVIVVISCDIAYGKSLRFLRNAGFQTVIVYIPGSTQLDPR
ncbi:unnamed protein product [Arabidopsis thaliana]|uniref:NYN domain-containing protein n=1 Tax=Arabidopsis thaliana TaxID=3702 RepID=A0A654FHL4_ARATH|nr:unnamed protein product [Arabidopsis thaliana]